MKYRLIYADPPWSYQNWTDAKNGAAVSAYPCLKDRDIVDLPVRNIAADDSMLFLWCTWPKLDVGLRAMQNWGFEYVTAPVVWVKTNADGSPYQGIGFWAVGGSEFLMMGRRGKGLPRRKDTKGRVRQVLTAPRTKHSAKPAGVREKILSLVGDIQPRVELFARPPVPSGWDATGLEYDEIDIRFFLNNSHLFQGDTDEEVSDCSGSDGAAARRAGSRASRI